MYNETIKQPTQVQNDFERIIRMIGTPAQPPKPRKKSLGRQAGNIQMGVLPQISPAIAQKIATEFTAEASNTIKQFVVNYAIARYVEVIYTPEGNTDGSVLFDKNLFNIYKHLPDDFLLQSDEKQLEIMQRVPLSKNFRIYDAATRAKPDVDQQGTDETISYKLALALKFIGRTDFILDILERVKKRNLPLDLAMVKSKVEETVGNLFLAKSLLETILKNESPFEFSAVEKSYIKDPFPVAFILEDESLLEPPSKDEYRSNSVLVLGLDIKIIATEERYLERLTAFCKQYDTLKNFQINTIEQIRKSPNQYATSTLIDSFGFLANSNENQQTNTGISCNVM